MTATQKLLEKILDLAVPFGPFLRRVDKSRPFKSWKKLLLFVIPRTFFAYWIFSLIPFVGTIIYMAVLVPLSARRHINIKRIEEKVDAINIYLWYFTVILIGFGGIWNFIGHTFMADTVATQIGWAVGSPFQIELAFYTLGSAVAALFAIWIKGHMITALIISKSIFLYGAGYVHIHDAVVNQNYSPLNIGTPLVGDIIFPTIFLVLLFFSLKADFLEQTGSN